jgi:hypothetical protein
MELVRQFVVSFEGCVKLNYKVIALILICLILLTSCFSARQSTPQASVNIVGTDDSVNTELTIASAGNQSIASQEASKPSASIIELYKNRDGALICNYQSYAARSTILQ